MIQHTNTYHIVKDLLASQESRKEFQRVVLLNSSASRDLWETQVSSVEAYINHVRKLLPVPQLVQVSEVTISFPSEGNGGENVGSAKAINQVVFTIISKIE